MNISTRQRLGALASAKRAAPFLVCLLLVTRASALGPDAPWAIAAGATIIGASAPTEQIEQTYYLGSIDPEDRLPPSFFRIRVNGQASFLSNMKFGSGWVPAYLVDTLSLDPTSIHQTSNSTQGPKFLHRVGSGLIQYGPEGFRRVPEANRLVIVMGASPHDFFQAVDTALGFASVSTEDRERSATKQQLIRLQAEKESLSALKMKFIKKSTPPTTTPSQTVEPQTPNTPAEPETPPTPPVAYVPSATFFVLT